MAARSHVTYLTACNSQSRDLHNRKTTTTTTTTDMEEHEEMSCIKWSKARPLTASSIGSFRFLLGSEPGRLCGVDECQNGYDFMGLILECLLKNRYSHYLSYETILGLCLIKCPIILAWDRSRYPAQSLTVNHAVNLHSGGHYVNLTWQSCASVMTSLFWPSEQWFEHWYCFAEFQTKTWLRLLKALQSFLPCNNITSQPRNSICGVSLRATRTDSTNSGTA